MQDDNPLWYDHAEPDEQPGPVLLAMAAAFAAITGAATLVRRIVWLPDRGWMALSGAARRRLRTRGVIRR